MTQIRTAHQVKLNSQELNDMFRAMTLQILLTAEAINQEQADAFAKTNMGWRGSVDGGMVFTLDPVWPEA